ALAAPTVGIVTTVAAVHTEFLGSLDGVREEKAGLVRALTADGVAVLNADDPRVAGMARDTRARVVTYGRAGHAHVRAVGVPADEFIGVGRAMQFAVEAAKEAGLAEARHLTTFEDTVAHLLKRLTAGDLVLVKGSRGMRMERVVDALVARLARSGPRSDGE